MRAILLGICAVVAGGVLVAMYRELARHFRDTATGARFHVSFAAEVAWAVVPCIILLAGAAPACWRVLSAQAFAAPSSRPVDASGHAGSAYRVSPAEAQTRAGERSRAGD